MRMGAYDRSIPYHDLPQLPPEENLIYSREIFESLCRANRFGMSKRLRNLSILHFLAK